MPQGMRYKITKKGIKKTKSRFSIWPVWYAWEVLRHLKGFQAKGKTRGKIQEHFKSERGAKGKVISNAIRHLIKEGYVEAVVVGGKDTPAISRRSPNLSSKTPRITPRVGRLK